MEELRKALYFDWDRYKNNFPNQAKVIIKAIPLINQLSKQIFMNTESVTVIPVDNTTAIALRDTLMQSIKKLKDDPKYIGQAKAINNTVQTLINMKKLDLQIAQFTQQQKQ